MKTQLRCRDLHAIAMAHFTDNDEDAIRIFAAGFVAGQAEKIYLGACRAAMFRPAEQHRPIMDELTAYIAELYGLRCSFHERSGEYWLHAPEYDVLVEEIGEMGRYIASCDADMTPENWQGYHQKRGRLCGIPLTEIDGNYHLRGE